MKNSNIKRSIMILIFLVTLSIFGSLTFASDIKSNQIDLGAPTNVEEVENISTEEVKNEENTEKLTSASKKILNGKTKKEQDMARLKDKYNDEFLGTVAYYLEKARVYSLPICFIGITIGAFNFLIVGNKKLDKKEQGFGWIVGFTIGLAVFNVIPLLYALLVIKK